MRSKIKSGLRTFVCYLLIREKHLNQGLFCNMYSYCSDMSAFSSHKKRSVCWPNFQVKSKFMLCLVMIKHVKKFRSEYMKFQVIQLLSTYLNVENMKMLLEIASLGDFQRILNGALEISILFCKGTFSFVK